MKTIFRATGSLLQQVRQDLARPHGFAFERVAFLTARAARGRDQLVLLAEGYHPVADEDYVRDETVGAMMGQEAIRKALNLALLNPLSVFHIHMHDHRGRPYFSKTDLREQPKFVPDFFKVRPEMPHGAIVLSRDFAAGRVWWSPKKVGRIAEFDVVGPLMSIDITPPGGITGFSE